MKSIKIPASRLALVALFAVACGGEPAEPTLPELEPRRQQRPPVIVVGIDGAEWSVIRRLWGEGRLPNLKRLAEQGTAASLETAYGESPVIWTTIATGRRPDEHGITDFVVATEGGTVPVSSSVRKVPALWNMASRAQLRTAVLGWWASWPAEPVEGVVVSDRSHLELDRIVHPESYAADFDRGKLLARQGYPDLGGRLASPDPWMENGAQRDRIMAHEAKRLVGLGFDLFLVYLRTVDIASHRYWKYLEPERFPGIPADELAEHAHIIPTVYDATDAFIGDLIAAAPAESQLFVLSDHGFFAGRDEPMVYLNSDRLLEHLGLRSVASSFDSPHHARLQKFRLSEPGQLDRVVTALESVTYDNGTPLFRVQRNGSPPGADLAAEVNHDEPTLTVMVEGEAYDDVVTYINRISGTHDAQTDGIFIAKGTHLTPGAEAAGISVHDIAPTLLYALGLPVAEDFAGRAWVELFTEAFRAGHPLTTVPSWGTMESWQVESSDSDRQLLDELRALGYL